MAYLVKEDGTLEKLTQDGELGEAQDNALRGLQIACVSAIESHYSIEEQFRFARENHLPEIGEVQAHYRSEHERLKNSILGASDIAALEALDLTPIAYGE